MNISEQPLTDRHRPVLTVLLFNHVQINAKLKLLAWILHPAISIPFASNQEVDMNAERG